MSPSHAPTLGELPKNSSARARTIIFARSAVHDLKHSRPWEKLCRVHDRSHYGRFMIGHYLGHMGLTQTYFVTSVPHRAFPYVLVA